MLLIPLSLLVAMVFLYVLLATLSLEQRQLKVTLVQLPCLQQQLKHCHKIPTRHVNDLFGRVVVRGFAAGNGQMLGVVA